VFDKFVNHITETINKHAPLKQLSRRQQNWQKNMDNESSPNLNETQKCYVSLALHQHSISNIFDVIRTHQLELKPCLKSLLSVRILEEQNETTNDMGYYSISTTYKT